MRMDIMMVKLKFSNNVEKENIGEYSAFVKGYIGTWGNI